MTVFLLSVLVCGVLAFRWFQKPKSNSHATRGTSPARCNRPTVPAIKKPIQLPSDGLVYPPIPESLKLTGRAYVIDGDTIRIKGIKIRLAGIDAPELDMPWGQKSKWAMVDICKGQIVTAELDGERSYDRLVGTCFLQDGRDIGAEIVKRGLALDLPHFSGGRYRKLEPAGARRMLCNGKFGHGSIRIVQSSEVRIRSFRN